MHRDGSSVMFPLGSRDVSGLATSDPPRSNDPVGIDLTPTPIPAAKLRIFHTKLNYRYFKLLILHALLIGFMFCKLYSKQESVGHYQQGKQHHNAIHSSGNAKTTYCTVRVDAGNTDKKMLKGCPRGVMVKAMDCEIVEREFVLQSRYNVHFRPNTLGKGMNLLILPAMD